MTALNIQIFQHVAFEGPAAIEPFFNSKGHRVEVNRLYSGEPAEIDSRTDALVIMGGPMGVGDESKYPWLAEEKRAIESALQKDLPILGICLGAQLLAEVLGAQVKSMGYREIGWFEVEARPEFLEHPLGKSFPPRFTPLHWHGDNFDIPQSAIRLGSSSACANQGFVYGDKHIGLQFHLEFDQKSVKRLARNAAHELTGCGSIHSETEMLEQPQLFECAESLLSNFLDDFIDQGKSHANR